MSQDFVTTLKATDLLPYLPTDIRDKGCWVAYSGGQDSHVLLHLLMKLKRSGHIKNIRAIHVNHNIQDESDQWSEHCQHMCDQMSIPLTLINVQDVDFNQGHSVEAQARDQRFKSFCETLIYFLPTTVKIKLKPFFFAQ